MSVPLFQARERKTVPKNFLFVLVFGLLFLFSPPPQPPQVQEAAAANLVKLSGNFLTGGSH